MVWVLVFLFFPVANFNKYFWVQFSKKIVLCCCNYYHDFRTDVHKCLGTWLSSRYVNSIDMVGLK